MKPLDAILAYVNGQLASHALYRHLLAHDEWLVPRPPGVLRPTIMVVDLAAPGAIWAFSSEASYEASCRALNAAAIGPIARLRHLDEALREDDERVTHLTIDPSNPIAFHVQTNELASLRRMAHAVAVERAMRERDDRRVLAYQRYAVPYFGELGRGHNLITLPSERGTMLAAFTAADAIDRFLAAGSDENRRLVKFAIVDGSQLFPIAQQVAQGVLMNPMGPSTFGFDLEACREVAAAG
ncbi:MAG: hypothetical protein MUC96_05825 [Myxococcaceae bacterium]|nr:hypothetical protein [Myxococcaceae bacterium]